MTKTKQTKKPSPTSAISVDALRAIVGGAQNTKEMPSK